MLSSKKIPILSSLIDFTLPTKCICSEKFTAKQGEVCEECFVDIKFSGEQNCCRLCSYPFEYDMGGDMLCRDCISETPYFEGFRYIFSYDEFTGKIIKNFKYKDATYLSKTLSNFLYNKAKLFDDIDVICSVPITGKRLRARKYNQSAMLAVGLAKKMQVKCDNLLLQKTRETRVQAGLNKKERNANLKNSFAVSKHAVNNYIGRNILVIDDVYTTGTTMNECAKTLKNSIDKCKVYGLALARVFV